MQISYVVWTGEFIPILPESLKHLPTLKTRELECKLSGFIIPLNVRTTLH
jgi:hypothetical protein